jgi:regulator of PEP synthase PpsR (kinase-PPPase family)
VLNIEPPPELFQVDRSKVVGLAISPHRLVEVRRARIARMRSRPSTSYTEELSIRRELDWANLLMRRESWPVLDVTNKSIEESAAEIVALLRTRTGTPHPNGT